MTVEERIIAWLAAQGGAAYLVGGWVRDQWLGQPSYDLDVAVPGDGLGLARRLADHFRGSYYPLDEERGTGRAIILDPQGQRLIVDVARFRGPDLAADLADRDFTINALAIDVHAPEQVIDHHGGLADLKAHLIRPVSEACVRNDPVRALRAIRLAAQLDFALAPEAGDLIRRDGAALDRVSGERVRDELAKLLALPQAAQSLQQLDGWGVLTAILPELEPLRSLEQPSPHHLPALAHSLATVLTLEDLLSELPVALVQFSGRIQTHLNRIMSDTRPRLVTLKLAALLHDVGKPAARTVDEDGRIRFIGHHEKGVDITSEALRRLRLSREEVRLGETIVRHHMRPLLLASQQGVTSRAVYRFFRDTGDAGMDVLLHALADRRAHSASEIEGEVWTRLVDLTARMLEDYWERQAERVDPPRLIDGVDLLREFELQPGPHVGELLEAVREGQVNGEVHTREEALALARRALAEKHHEPWPGSSDLPGEK